MAPLQIRNSLVIEMNRLARCIQLARAIGGLDGADYLVAWSFWTRSHTSSVIEYRLQCFIAAATLGLFANSCSRQSMYSLPKRPRRYSIGPAAIPASSLSRSASDRVRRIKCQSALSEPHRPTRTLNTPHVSQSSPSHSWFSQRRKFRANFSHFSTDRFSQ